MTEISYLKILHIHLGKLLSKGFAVGLSGEGPFGFLLTKTGHNCSKQPLKATEEDKEKIQEVKVGLANAEEISMIVEVAAVLSELGGISH